MNLVEISLVIMISGFFLSSTLKRYGQCNKQMNREQDRVNNIIDIMGSHYERIVICDCSPEMNGNIATYKVSLIDQTSIREFEQKIKHFLTFGLSVKIEQPNKMHTVKCSSSYKEAMLKLDLKQPLTLTVEYPDQDIL